MSLYVYHFYTGGPSRLVWFVLGAVVATILVKRKEIQKRRALRLINGLEEHPALPWMLSTKCGHRHRHQREPEPLQDTPRDHQEQAQYAPPPPASSQCQKKYSEKSALQSTSIPLGSSDQQWEVVDEKEKTSVISVETLDNVLSTVDELKAVSFPLTPQIFFLENSDLIDRIFP